MSSPKRFSTKEDKFEISPSINSQKGNCENSSKDTLMDSKLTDPVIILSNPLHIQLESNQEVLEKKKKLKPDQLIFIKTLLTINFFGFVIILINALFVYIRLFAMLKNFDVSFKDFAIITSIGLFADILFVLGWVLYFIAALKRKLDCLKISIFLVFFSILLKLVSFFGFIGIFGQEKGNNGFIVASSLYLCFQIFSIWNYVYVYTKMQAMPEKNWKKAFRRPKGKYMYAQE